VYRVGAAYLAVVFGALQAADLVFPALGLGSRAFNALVLTSLLGFPLAVALAWMFDITASGIRRTAPTDAVGAAIAPAGGWVRLHAALVGAGFVAVLWFGVHLWRGPASQGEGVVAPASVPVLAVLPFQDLSPEGDQAYFADGLHEEVLHQLAVVRGLRLISRTSVLHFRNSSATIPAIADSLGARYVLEGSVRMAADSVRVTVQLIDAEVDAHLWSESFDRALSLEGLFDLQRTLAMRLSRSLVGTLSTGTAERLGSAPTTSLEAYNAFLRGLHHWNNFTRPSMKAAADDFREAIALDPEFGRAHGMLAMVYVVQNNLGMGRSEDLFPLVRKHADLAIRYAPEDPQSHMALSTVRYTLERDWMEARNEIEHTLELDPGFSQGRWAMAEWYGIVAGETERALETVDEVLRIDPFSATAGVMRASILHFGRRYGEAAEEYRRLRDLDPGNPVNTMNLVSNLALSGRVDEARAILDEALPRVRHSYGPTLAVHLARVGEGDLAAEVRTEAEARRASGASIPAYALAAAAVAVGDREGALTWLERSFADEGGIYTLRDPLWDPLRDDPRFQALWDRVDLPGEPPPAAPG
jgi:serine/threonine-protein kinase